MKMSKGTDIFDCNIFNWYDWSANYYESSEEVISYLQSLDVVNKKVKSIYAIGALCDRGIGYIEEMALSRLHDCGIIDSYDLWEGDIDVSKDGRKLSREESLELIDNVSIKRKIILYEPLVITFEDDTTLELQICKNSRIRIGRNTIPKAVKDGTNKTELDITTLFGEFIEGKELEDFCVDCFSESWRWVIRSGGIFETGSKRSISLKLYFSNGKLILSETELGGFEVSFTKDKKIRIGEIRQQRKLQQFEIMDQTHHHSHWIITTSKGAYIRNKDNDPYHKDYIGLPLDVPVCSVELFSRYFDPDIQENNIYEKRKGYDNYDSNYYTNESMLKILSELEGLCASAERTENVYERADILNFRTDLPLNELERYEIMEMDYIKRFIHRIRLMVKNNKDDYIVLSGP